VSSIEPGRTPRIGSSVSGWQVIEAANLTSWKWRRKAIRNLQIQLEVESHEQVDHTIRGLVSKEPTCNRIGVAKEVISCCDVTDGRAKVDLVEDIVGHYTHLKLKTAVAGASPAGTPSPTAEPAASQASVAVAVASAAAAAAAFYFFAKPKCL
jgi:hypothetical protein